MNVKMYLHVIWNKNTEAKYINEATAAGPQKNKKDVDPPSFLSLSFFVFLSFNLTSGKAT